MNKLAVNQQGGVLPSGLPQLALLWAVALQGLD